MTAIDEIEHLAARVSSLSEAVELAAQANPGMLVELRSLYHKAIGRICLLASKILRGRFVMGVSNPRISLEVLERLFIVVRDSAEQAWVNSLKASGKESKRLKKEADRLARLAHTSAVSLKVVAESRGIWSTEYSSEHGVDSWL